jgi:hypothetical protein
MLLAHTELVTPENGPRPFGRPDRCFYCGQALGAEHAPGCVLRRKVVMVEVTLRIPRVVPAAWDSRQVEFQLNDGSWCADNIEGDLAQYQESRGDDAPCLCGAFHAKFLREATAEDLQGLDLVTLSGGA